MQVKVQVQVTITDHGQQTMRELASIEPDAITSPMTRPERITGLYTPRNR